MLAHINSHQYDSEKVLRQAVLRTKISDKF